MLSHEMHMKTIAEDRFSARLREAEVHRFSKKHRRPSSLLTAIGKATAAVRSAVPVLTAAKSSAVNDRRAL